MDTLSSYVFTSFNILIVTPLVLYVILLFRKLYSESLEGEASMTQKTTSFDDMIGSIPWDELGNAPAYGDTSDLGAVDIALKLNDLHKAEEDSDNWSEKAYYKQQISDECKRLVEITLVQAMPLEPTTDKDLYFDPTPENLITFDKEAFRQRLRED